MLDTFGGLIDSIAGIQKMEATLAAAKAELIEQARQWAVFVESTDAPADARGWNDEIRARRVLVTELACALRLPERTVESLNAESSILLTELPATFAALSAGQISWRHTRIMIDQALSMPEESRRDFEEALLPKAAVLTPSKFQDRARKLRERLHPELIDVRHEESREKRCIEVIPDRDGMAWLNIYQSAVVVQGIVNRVGDMAAAQPARDDDPRTQSQWQADLAAELLLDGRLHSGRDSGIRPTVIVTVPVLSMLGASDEPAVLEGYGPIDMGTAMELAAAAPGFIRLLTHPETGAALSLGTARYPNTALRTWLRQRDGTCRFPGCARAARRCDIDHTVDYQHGGETAHFNLAHLCPAHHRLKHMTGWDVEQLGQTGIIQWTSPTGKTYRTEPELQMEPAAGR